MDGFAGLWCQSEIHFLINQKIHMWLCVMGFSVTLGCILQQKLCWHGHFRDVTKACIIHYAKAESSQQRLQCFLLRNILRLNSRDHPQEKVKDAEGLLWHKWNCWKSSANFLRMWAPMATSHGDERRSGKCVIVCVKNWKNNFAWKSQRNPFARLLIVAVLHVLKVYWRWIHRGCVLFLTKTSMACLFQLTNSCSFNVSHLNILLHYKSLMLCLYIHKI